MSRLRAEGPDAHQRRPASVLGLAFVPLAAALLVGMLLLPRRPDPDALPIPIADPKALARTFEIDMDLAERARAAPLPGTVRALGSALRDLHTLEARSADTTELGKAREALDTALIEAQPSGEEALLELRAFQLEAFIIEVDAFVRRGVESPELAALGGGFVRAMRTEGWCDGHKLALTGAQLRAMFKQMWAAVLGLDGRPPFALTLNEQRALYALTLSRPHLSARMREDFARAKHSAKSPRECQAIEEARQAAIEKGSLDHIQRLASIDPLYPAAYARGVASYRAGHFGAASEAFTEWLMAHPNGVLALRARNYLRSARTASQVE